MKTARLAIIMAHYNNPEGLEASIASISEPFNVDIIVVDDGSDKKPDKKDLNNIYKNGKIIFHELPHNSGVGIAANLGLKKAIDLEYEFIGRLDCGDFFMTNKCEKQIRYLDKNEEIKLLGTWANVVNEKGEFLYKLQYPVDYKTIRKRMYLNSMFLNPSVIFRSEIVSVVGDYPLKYRRAAQDYAFFFKVINKFKAENYPEVLMDYVIESHSISTKKRRLQVINRMRIIIDNFYFGFQPIYGLLRSVILLFASRKLTTYAKKRLAKND